MTRRKIIISGTGCALADFLYNNVSFNSPVFKKYISKRPGDGGLNPGKLVFTEELEKFTNLNYQQIIKSLIKNRFPDAFNIGGPSLVSLIHASQLLDDLQFEVKFYGMTGNDEIAKKIFKILSKTPLNILNYHKTNNSSSPFTHVLSDPDFDNGNGERTFINNIGAASEFTPEYLDESFFNSQITCFGGTALVPKIHDNLTELLEKAKYHNCITLVNTVYDFRNEKRNPGKPWPLIKSINHLKLIDILIMDAEESMKISGQPNINLAADFLKEVKVPCFIITNGANDLLAWSGGGLFRRTELIQLPVSEKVKAKLNSNNILKGDTTGCGDNFVGGVIASLAWQIKTKKKGSFDLIEAISWGIASGGFCCFYMGGVYNEMFSGEKKIIIQEIQAEYLGQLHE